VELQLHWYPGHMAKASRELKARLKLVDAVLEVVDARLPVSSRHPSLVQTGRPLGRVLLLGRADLADPRATDAWLRYFRAQGLPAVAADLRQTTWVTRARRLLQQAAGVAGGSSSEATEERSTGKPADAAVRRPPGPTPAKLGRRGVRVMVVGLPNVGKSTAINGLAGRAKAGTGAKAGVTRRVQWLAAGGLELLDSPGLLWPEATRGQKALHLAVAGLVPDDAFDPLAVAEAFLADLADRFPAQARARYGEDLAPAGASLLETVARRLGLWLPGGRPDLGRAATMVLHDFRHGRLGRLTLELPPGGA